jgi:hypothetical protein
MMQIPVLIEAIPGNGYRASGGSPLSLSAEGTTRDEALRRFSDLVQKRMKDGAELVIVEVPSPPHPFARFAGTWKADDPLVQQWEEAVEDFRRQADENADLP